MPPLTRVQLSEMAETPAVETRADEADDGEGMSQLLVPMPRWPMPSPPKHRCLLCLTKSDAARLEVLLEQAAELEGEERYECLVEATGVAVGEEQVRLYLEASKTAPRSVRLHWKVGQRLTLSGEHAQKIAAGLDELAESDFDGAAEAFSAHRLVFGAVHLERGENR